MFVVLKLDSDTANYGGFHKWGNSRGNIIMVAKFMKTLVEIQDGTGIL